MAPTVDPYAMHVTRIRDHGAPHIARERPTLELLNTTLSVRAGYIPGRDKMNRALGYMELMQLLAGVFRRSAIETVAPKANIELFSHQSAYGPRIGTDLANAIELLDRVDRGSRQAVVLFPSNNESLGVRPCTIAAQFLIRNGRMFGTFTMRSSDGMWGLPYDIMQFGGLTLALANAFDCSAGHLTIFAGSSHLYTDTMKDTPPQPSKSRMFSLPKMTGTPAERMRKYGMWAMANVELAPWPNGIPLGVTEVPYA